MSRLLYVELENFMSLPKAKLEFDDKGIISPVGYNDSGKSAITRACEVLWFDAYVTTQVKFITDGEEYFTVSNVFDDGVTIKRTKYLNGSSHWEMTNNGQVVYTNQLANGSFAATKGVPEAIQAYLQVFKDDITGELLNIRRNTNRLLLVATSGGDNYKFINNQAQGERLAYATGELNKDLNAITQEQKEAGYKLAGLRDAYSRLEVFDVRLEQDIAQRAAEIQGAAATLGQLCTIAEKYRAFYNMEVREDIPLLDITAYEKLTKISEACAAMSQTVVDDIPVIDTTQLALLDSLLTAKREMNKQVIEDIPLLDDGVLSKLAMLEKLKGSAEQLKQKVIADVAILDTSRFEFLCKLHEKAEQLHKASAALATQEQELQTMRAALTAEAAANNWRICSNCGEVVTDEVHAH